MANQEGRILSWDPTARIKSLFHYDHSDDSFIIERRQDVEPILDNNKALMNATVGGAKHYDSRRFIHRVASIPLNLYYELKRKGILDDEKRFAQWLNDPDNRHFRTNRARI